MGLKRNKRIFRVYVLLLLGFLFFTAGSINLVTKAVLLKYGVRTRGQIADKFQRDYLTSGYAGSAVVMRVPHLKIKYQDLRGKMHFVNMKRRKSIYRKYASKTTVDLIYNPRFPDYSVKFADSIDQSTWGPDIILTVIGIMAMGGGVLYAQKNHVSVTQ
ncbi:MAG: hypothetical protein K8I00_08285 [Candidatus Omnitrophica bacterium]|nr:hypothetical protein [Candidatus Omnitrophota bacterium]